MAFLVREATPSDLSNKGITRINLDYWTETYNSSFYLHYLLSWPDLFLVAVDMKGVIVGYIMGKVEGEGKEYHSHVTAVTVDPNHRRCGIASALMQRFEEISNQKSALFCDLFVRVSNELAVGMYKKMGYVVYRRVIEYYSGEHPEDAYDMRKPLAADPSGFSILPAPKNPVYPEDLGE